MSRIGRSHHGASGVDVAIEGQDVTSMAEGNAELQRAEPLTVVREDGEVKVTRPNDEGRVRACTVCRAP